MSHSDISDEDAQHIADEVNSLVWPDKQKPMTPRPITLHWPSLTSRRKNEVVHQYVALNGDMLDVPDYVVGDHAALVALLGKTDPHWSYVIGVVTVMGKTRLHCAMTNCHSFNEAACIALLRTKGVVVET